MKKPALIALFLASFFFSFKLKAEAVTEFDTVYDVRYQVMADGIVHVSQKVALTNRLSNVYATRYSLNLQAGKITNVQARDDEGSLEIVIEETAGQTQLGLTFNQKVVGKDKTLNFVLEYDAHDLATKTGQIWSVMVPKLAEPELIDQYSLTLAVPQKFGRPAFVTPNPTSQSQTEELFIYQFTKAQLATSGVNAAFGQFQIFDFVLTYHLRNPYLTTGVTEIALPPDTAYQRVFYSEIKPQPENVVVDEDGNWLATFKLGGGEKLSVIATGKVKIFAEPQTGFLLPSEASLAKNLLPQSYWGAEKSTTSETEDEEEVWSPLIQRQAERLKTPEQIYQFVVKTLDYDYSRVKEGTERLGAIQILTTPQRALCMEFTDLFVALARAAGIPAREVNGYAYTTNPKLRPLSLVADILHSWPEYWDEAKQVWVPVDPTWEKTTGGTDYFHKVDLNHFAFAIHGQSSVTPYPAGAYKIDNNFTKDVQVVFGRYEIEVAPVLEIQLDLPTETFFEIQGQGKVIVKNPGPTAVYQLPVKIQSEGLTLKSPGEMVLPVLPPFGQKEIPLRFSSQFFQFGQGELSIALDGQEFQHSLRLRSLLLERILPLTGAGLLLTFIFFRVKKKMR